MSENRSGATRALLPSGFPDMCYPLSERHYMTAHSLTLFFMQHGYLYTKPPLMEYAESFSCGDASFQRTLFRATDPLSKETIAVRADITVQISRIAAEHGSIDNGRPLRLCYSGQVARVTPESAGGLRERTQVGAEYIGGSLTEGMHEITEILLRNLRRFGIEGAVMDIGLPQLVCRCAAMLGLSVSEEKVFRQALALKDKAVVKRMLHGFSSGTVDAAWLTGLRDTDDALLSALPEELRPCVEAACLIVKELKRTFPDITFCIDPADVRHFSYHRDIVFSVYAPGSGRELARGGHYIVDKQDAVGVTFYIEDICAAAQTMSEESMICVLVPRTLPYQKVAALITDGYRIRYACSSVESSELKCEAIAVGAGFYYTFCGDLLSVDAP